MCSSEEMVLKGTVTVIIPTYKRSEKLKRAVLSVLNQTYSDLKVIICDNASGDETRSVVEELMENDDRVSYFQHAENIGMNNNFNFGVSKVTTPFFCLLTDDDYYFPHFLSDAMSAFEMHPMAMFSALEVPAVMEGDEDKYLNRQLRKWPREGFFLPCKETQLLAINGSTPVLTGCVFRREIISKIYFDKRVGHISDMPILISLLSTYPFYLSKKVGLVFIHHEESMGLHPDWHLWLEVEKVLGETDALPAGVYLKIISQLKRNTNKRIYAFLVSCLRRHDRDLFNEAFKVMLMRSGVNYKMRAYLIFLLFKVPILAELFLLNHSLYKYIRSVARTAYYRLNLL